MQKLLTVKEAADLLKVSCFTIYRKALDGKIPSLKVGKLRRFQESSLTKWITKSEIYERRLKK